MRPEFTCPIFCFALCMFISASAANDVGNSKEQPLSIVSLQSTKNFTINDLLARSDVTDIKIEGDVYHGEIKYRAVPLLSLLDLRTSSNHSVLEVRARDGFIGEIPLSLVEDSLDGGSTAYIAVEEPKNLWPPLPHQTVSAGPFYIVWMHPEVSGVSHEQAPYQVVSITLVDEAIRRWPQLLPSNHLPNDSPLRYGEKVFEDYCFPCHQMKRAGVSHLGLDLGLLPGKSTLGSGELRSIIRNPRGGGRSISIQMPAFDEKSLLPNQLDALLLYLDSMRSEASVRSHQ
ncbi:mono/diheme cytochrome c family protein [Methylobacterium sp. OAE515]|uniref:c-type cytochrome n=1 Tax=Methylobacterium sp. OAE515 TaxID=2817895 RepID=UPI00178BA25F